MLRCDHSGTKIDMSLTLSDKFRRFPPLCRLPGCGVRTALHPYHGILLVLSSIRTLRRRCSARIQGAFRRVRIHHRAVTVDSAAAVTRGLPDVFLRLSGAADRGLSNVSAWPPRPAHSRRAAILPAAHLMPSRPPVRVGVPAGRGRGRVVPRIGRNRRRACGPVRPLAGGRPRYLGGMLAVLLRAGGLRGGRSSCDKQLLPLSVVACRADRLRSWRDSSIAAGAGAVGRARERRAEGASRAARPDPARGDRMRASHGFKGPAEARLPWIDHVPAGPWGTWGCPLGRAGYPRAAGAGRVTVRARRSGAAAVPRRTIGRARDRAFARDALVQRVRGCGRLRACTSGWMRE